jgi:hypothetical protein
MEGPSRLHTAPNIVPNATKLIHPSRPGFGNSEVAPAMRWVCT